MTVGRPAILGGDPIRRTAFAPRRTMGDEEKQAAIEVIESDELSAFIGGAGKYFHGGEKVQGFERAWAQKFGFEHVISVNSCTSGLVAAIGACGIGPGDEVICSPYTMSASATCVMFYGGIPVFADVLANTGNLNPASIEASITDRTRAIVVVHLFGQPADMDEILAIAKRHRLKVIEDAAQSPGVYYKGRPVGGIGDLGVFSLNYHKHIHAGEGGLIVTNDDELALRCQLIRNHGENVADTLDASELINVIGHNFRLTEIQAAIGSEQVKRLDGYLEHRQRLALHLHRCLVEIDGLKSYPCPGDRTHAYYLFPMLYEAERIGLPRSHFVRAVSAELPQPEGFESTPLTEGYMRPLYLGRVYQEKQALTGGYPWDFNPDVLYDYTPGLCPVAERLYAVDLVLSSLVREPLTESDIDDFVAAMKKVAECAPAINAALGDPADEEPYTPVSAAMQTDVR